MDSEKFVSFLQWVGQNSTSHACTSYLDEFFFCNSNLTDCVLYLQRFDHMSGHINQPMTPKKAV